MRYNGKGTLIAPPQISVQLGIFRREDGMAARLSITRAAAVVALLALGCKKDPDPAHFKLAAIHSGPQLTDTLWRHIPYGTREALAWEMMQRNGFYCLEVGRTPVEIPGTIGFGERDLQCSRSTRINFGLRRREFWVWFQLDSGRVSGINTLSFKQDI